MLGFVADADAEDVRGRHGNFSEILIPLDPRDYTLIRNKMHVRIGAIMKMEYVDRSIIKYNFKC